jgi:replicative DNA helicase
MGMDFLLTCSDTASNMPIYYPIEYPRDRGELTLKWLRDAVAKAKEENGISVVFIDHLHFLLPLRDMKNPSLVIGGIVREIKRIAVDNGVGVVLIVHLTKTDADKVATVEDIRDSSFITQESDYAMIIQRERLGAKKGKKDFKSADDVMALDGLMPIYSNRAFLSLETNRRTGKTGRIVLWWNGMVFEDYKGQDSAK